MRTYLDIETFSEWSREEKDAFSIRVLKGIILDGVRKANSGHSGGPLSSIDFAYYLFTEFSNFDPADPDWFNRDRFVLSAGHESMLLYTLLFMIGWLSMDDLKQFRQLHSQTPGHPEVHIPGVEATTGPLGQGVGMGIGMAVGEMLFKNICAEKTGIDTSFLSHKTYILCSDGDLQEPVALGAASLAGHWQLRDITMFYDANDAQISGNTDRADSTDYGTIFEGFGWHVQQIDGHNHEGIRDAIQKSHVMENPSLIIGKTQIANETASMEGDHETHGKPLPFEEIDATKEKLGLSPETFYLPNEVRNHFQNRFPKLTELRKEWDKELNTALETSSFKKFWNMTMNNQLPDLSYPEFEQGASIATRKAFGYTLDKFATQLPHIVGGSADLEPSNYTTNFAKTYGDFSKSHTGGRNLAFGVREFPMGTICNGLAHHGGIIPFGGTFLVFSDYSRPAIRLSAIQNLRVIYEFTHDSFYVGEDGPTHQPVEHIMSLRVVPNLNVYRPADAKETAASMACILQDTSTPSVMLLSRQGLPVLDCDISQIKEGVGKGGYIVKDCTGEPEITIIATGSEVSLGMEVSSKLNDLNCRVVSIPCWEKFFLISKDERSKIIPDDKGIRISIEAGATLGWERLTGDNGLNIGIDHFGASAPHKDLAEEFGFVPEKIETQIREHLQKLKDKTK
ncbi:MAG: transketolase [Candidatus Marinimicrobia bacterium]|jgi:transketolase|nr:transketolase [Candidatus Neomarinimicrobiota bacterium]